MMAVSEMKWPYLSWYIPKFTRHIPKGPYWNNRDQIIQILGWLQKQWAGVCTTTSRPKSVNNSQDELISQEEQEPFFLLSLNFQVIWYKTILYCSIHNVCFKHLADTHMYKHIHSICHSECSGWHVLIFISLGRGNTTGLYPHWKKRC